MFRGDDSVEAEVAAELFHKFLLTSLAWMRADAKSRAKK
jgi:hypothetical protein